MEIKMTDRKEEEFIEALYGSLKESYPDCLETVKEQFNLIKEKKEPTNVIGMMIIDDVKKFLER